LLKNNALNCSKLWGGVLPHLVETIPGQYEIIAGEWRYRTAQAAGLAEVPVVVRDMDDKEARFAMLAENLQRQDLDAEDEKHFFEQLQSEFNYSQKEIAELVNKSRAYVSQILAGKPSGKPVKDSEKGNNNSENEFSLQNSQPVKCEPGGKIARRGSGSFRCFWIVRCGCWRVNRARRRWSKFERAWQRRSKS
jgi:hypothetical protein